MAGRKTNKQMEAQVNQAQQEEMLRQAALQQQSLQMAETEAKMEQQEQANKEHDTRFSNYGANGNGVTTMEDPEGNVIVIQKEPVIGKDQVAKANEILQKYKQGKANLEKKITENEQWWKLRHWTVVQSQGQDSDKRIKPVSAWLFNSLANKHADMMDNYPEPNVLGRKQEDEETAKMLSDILPIILEQNNYEKTYSDACWYKLKQGTAAYGVFWDNNKNNGLGDIVIRKCDILNLFWQPGISDIQESPHFFNVTLEDNEHLKEQYPEARIDDVNPTIDVAKYIYDDTVDTSGKSAVVDWYYKKHMYEADELGNPTVRTTLQYCKFVNGNVLYASENDPNYANKGWYDHGKYPFVFDPLFTMEGTPCGFGFIDVMKDSQLYIDKMQQAILENAISSARPRFIIREDGSINEKDFLDISKVVIKTQGNLGEDSFRQINANSLSGIHESVLGFKVNELKETSGNTDVSRGETTSGVTAASAISALQEASGKLSRDLNKQSYRAYQEQCYMVIELIRQFYDMPRAYRLTGMGGVPQYVEFDNSGMLPQAQGQAFGVDLGSRMPIFDIEVVAQKKSAYTKMSQNELAIQFYNLGFFAPNNADMSLACLQMMDFDDKDKIISKVQENGTMYQRLMQLQQVVLEMSAQLDQLQGTNNTPQMAQAMARNDQVAAPSEGERTGSGLTQQQKASQTAANAASPR